MEWGQQMRKHQQNARDAMYQNTNYNFERNKSKLILLEVAIGGTNKDFSVKLSDPLIIDKFSDIYLDSFTTFKCKANTSTENYGFKLKINEFKIKTIVASNLNITTTEMDSEKVNSIFIPNEEESADKTRTHKGKKMNYICSINPTKLTSISGTITDAGTHDDPPVYSNAFEANGRFIAEFVIVAND